MKKNPMVALMMLVLIPAAAFAQSISEQLVQDGYIIVEKAQPTPFNPASEAVSKSCVSDKLSPDVVEAKMSAKIEELRNNKATDVEGQVSGDRYVIFYTAKKTSELGEIKYFDSSVVSDAQHAHNYFQKNLKNLTDEQCIIVEGILYGKFFQNGMKYVHTIKYAKKVTNIRPHASERCEVN